MQLTKHPDVEVEADDAPWPASSPEDEYWLNDDVPQNPFNVFEDAFRRLGDIIAEYGVGGRGTLPHSADVINRMVYASAIGAMEAFLSDTLVNTVRKDNVFLDRLLKGDNELSKISVSLSEISGNPFVVMQRTQTHLASLIYHNLAKIGNLYKVVLNGVEILPDPELRKRLMKAVLTRHDIVHRNGKDKDGAEVGLPTALVTATIDDVRTFVTHVNSCVTSALIAAYKERYGPSEGAIDEMSVM
ncbi:hypothetical protein [Cupriavidus sp. IK-TO18]|uniref:hypothetical protein n=1 Tax=Cupriavidus sp. IK-TO18 TaxID=2782182 RepID=UPI00189B4DE2|nr:hypothetical protein [Cupriavidus sp. IK-TO18]